MKEEYVSIEMRNTTGLTIAVLEIIDLLEEYANQTDNDGWLETLDIAQLAGVEIYENHIHTILTVLAIARVVQGASAVRVRDGKRVHIWKICE